MCSSKVSCKVSHVCCSPCLLQTHHVDTRCTSCFYQLCHTLVDGLQARHSTAQHRLGRGQDSRKVSRPVAAAAAALRNLQQGPCAAAAQIASTNLLHVEVALHSGTTAWSLARQYDAEAPTSSPNCPASPGAHTCRCS